MPKFTQKLIAENVSNKYSDKKNIPLKIKKKKEHIRKQILLKIKYYRNSRGITFFENLNELNNEKVKLESNELEVVVINLSRQKRVLLTTKNIYYLNKNSVQKIVGDNIERFDYMEFVNGEKIIEEKSRLKTFWLRFKINFRIGTYRIIERNNSFIELKIWKTNLADCLNDGIKKLKFVVTKYEGI
ncbi:hypothetical protein [Tenacibaculum maritimum]|uniref:hypothetical protein n=1 Tax=Tenacibaculum maritimum TaxID=107401 RepID=UPI0012E41ADC|nr:hypothetical protein [Tenacibaculum maritimum]CAA0219944.1 conserved hypothetical protein [Tenacibaculum maritimum]